MTAASTLVPRLGVRFVLSYALIAGAAFTLYAFPFELFGAQRDWLAGYLRGYARLAGGVLGLFDSSVQVSGARIDGRYPLEIVRNCDAIEVNILFASAVLAFPAPFARRGPVLVVGLALLVALNVARICALYFVGVHYPGWFRVAHEEVLPLVLIAATALSFSFATRYLDARS